MLRWWLWLWVGCAAGQTGIQIEGPEPQYTPLQQAVARAAPGEPLEVRDGAGRVYARGVADAQGRFRFLTGGALGHHQVRGERSKEAASFVLDASTAIQDEGGVFHSFLDAAIRTMKSESAVTRIWRGQPYRMFEYWILDHNHTAKGMQYFSPDARGLVDLLAQAQRADGMIWSFAETDTAAVRPYHYWAYAPYGYAWHDGGILFARQPVENHPESNFVDALYGHWKASGDDAWMRGHLDAAAKALRYSITDEARWSQRFQLLKRGYTIDSWDFQPRDRYLVEFPMGSEQLIDPQRTKFTIFFGDNHHYAAACEQLAEMMDRAGRPDAAEWRERAREIRERLERLTWNGRFYTHHVEEDPTVRRELGVPEEEQLAMSNLYALNRGIAPDRADAIVARYQALRENLPHRSPGEWYSVYPPYDRGFGKDSGRWQYMNAGVHAHAAAELARGALQRGHEAYGVDVLRRLASLAAKSGKLYFAYTGGYDPAPPPAVYEPLDLSALSTMDLRAESGLNRMSWFGLTNGNDASRLPRGRQELAGVPYQITDAAIGLTSPSASARIPVGRKAGAVYLLHGSSDVPDGGVAGILRFLYADGKRKSIYIRRGQHLNSMWFPALSSPVAGVAWRGANRLTGDVGVFWAAIENPEPDRVMEALEIAGPEERGGYAVIAMTLASRMPYQEPPAESFGGPDHWSGGLAVHALIEGLAGVRNDGLALSRATVSPRWSIAGVKQAAVTVRLQAGSGYVCYDLREEATEIRLRVTGSAQRAVVRIPVTKDPVSASLDGSPAPFRIESVRTTRYAVVETDIRQVRDLRIRF